MPDDASLCDLQLPAVEWPRPEVASPPPPPPTPPVVAAGDDDDDGPPREPTLTEALADAAVYGHIVAHNALLSHPFPAPALADLARAVTALAGVSFEALWSSKPRALDGDDGPWARWRRAVAVVAHAMPTATPAQRERLRAAWVAIAAADRAWEERPRGDLLGGNDGIQ